MKKAPLWKDAVWVTEANKSDKNIGKILSEQHYHSAEMHQPQLQSEYMVELNPSIAVEWANDTLLENKRTLNAVTARYP